MYELAARVLACLILDYSMDELGRQAGGRARSGSAMVDALFCLFFCTWESTVVQGISTMLGYMKRVYTGGYRDF